MLDEVECDAVGVGDYFAKRGSIAIEALKRGKHVISDKPLCTSLDELAQIRELSQAKSKYSSAIWNEIFGNEDESPINYFSQKDFSMLIGKTRGTVNNHNKLKGFTYQAEDS